MNEPPLTCNGAIFVVDDECRPVLPVQVAAKVPGLLDYDPLLVTLRDGGAVLSVEVPGVVPFFFTQLATRPPLNEGGAVGPVIIVVIFA
jgi:hypothetical protein